MEFDLSENNQQQPEIKQCIFCAETIQAAAVKCRFCGEYLNTPKAKALEEKLNSEEDEFYEADDAVLFCARPSLFGMLGTVLRAGFFIAAGFLLIRFPLEQQNWFTIAESRMIDFAQYRTFSGYGLIGLCFFILLYKMIRLKCMSYEVTANRVEFSRGIFNRRVDNLDMFRVVDLKLRRTMLDCLTGIGTVTLITSDKTDPTFSFEKIHRCRELYDIIKNTSLEADRAAGVVHLE